MFGFLNKKSDLDNLIVLIAKKTNSLSEEVKPINYMDFSSKKSRYLYVLVEKKNDQKSIFIKVAREKYVKKLLKREGLALEIASNLSINNLKIFYPFQKLNWTYSFLGREDFNPKSGTLITSHEEIAAAPAKLGKDVARFILSFSGKKIPLQFDISCLRKDDWRNNLLTMLKGWDNQNKVLCDPEFSKEVEEYIDQDYLCKTSSDTEKLLKPILEKADSNSNWYFAHNDTAPNNFFYIQTGDRFKIKLFDFEYAGAAHNQLLAIFTDLSNFYGRAWANPKLQKEFLAGCLENLEIKNSEDKYNFTKALAVFSTTDLAHFKLLRSSPTREAMFKALLSSLKENLEYLESLK